MASINYAHKEIISKIVYYGPGVSGKTTNLQYVFKKIPSDTRGELISLATDADRTLYFDFLPINIGSIQGFTTKFQLYTVPGQVYYNATRKLVLRGVDGVVFVADSQNEKMDENIESFQNLRDNLIEYGYDPDEIPTVIQYNKRDLPNAAPIEEMQKILNEKGLPYYEAVASDGDGVFKTLKAISKLVLEEIRTKTMGAPKKVKPIPKPVLVGVGAGSFGGSQNLSESVVAEPQKISPSPVVTAPKTVTVAPAAQTQVSTEVPKVESIAPQAPVEVQKPEVQAVVEEPKIEVESIAPQAPVEVQKPEVQAVVEEPKAEVETETAEAQSEPVIPEVPIETQKPEVNVDTTDSTQQVELKEPEDIIAETDQSLEEKPGIMNDEETLANVVVSDSQGLPQEEEEEPVKDDLEETTERSILREEDVTNLDEDNNADETTSEANPDVSLQDNTDETSSELNQPEKIENNLSEDVSEPVDKVIEQVSEVEEPQQEAEKVFKPSLGNFDEDSTQASDLSFNSPLPLGKPQMAESRKMKNKRRFSFFGLFKKKKK